METLKRALALGVAIIVASTTVVLAGPAETASAANPSAFDPGLIISDDNFFNGRDLTAAQIQTFLNSRGANCNNYVSGGTEFICMKNFTMKTSDRAATSYCKAIKGSNSESAAEIIAKVAQACDIGARVLLVTLQKEQGLVTSAKSRGTYNFAMGYGCPDHPPGCKPEFAGFSYQIFRAAQQFQIYRLTDFGSFKPKRNNTILYHPSGAAKCGQSTVYIQNQATAGLYNYTPYQPNQALLSGKPNSCSSYGNYNFWALFTDWFGSPASLLKNGSFQSGTSNWGSGSNGAIKYKGYNNAAKSHSPAKYATISTTVPGRRFQQTVKIKTVDGEIYTGAVWLRAANDGDTVSGRLRLWTVSGTTDTVRQEFTVGSEWTLVTVDLPIMHRGHTGIRFVIEVDTVKTNLRVDSAVLYRSAVQESRSPLVVENTAVESGVNGGWVRSDSKQVTTKRAYVHGPVHGKYYVKTQSKVPGTHVYQRIPRETVVGESYTAGMWVRSGSADEPFVGTLRLLGMGGKSEWVDTAFEVGPEWTYITATLDIKNTSHKSLRIYLFHESTNFDLLFDKIVLVPNLYTRGASFEDSTSTLNPRPSGTSVTVMHNDQLRDGGFGLARDGVHALRIESSSASESYVRIDRNLVLVPGQTFTSAVWVKSAIPGSEQNGVLALEARNSDGSVAERTEVPFVATDEWALVSVAHTIDQAAVTRLRTEIRIVDEGGALLVDGVQLN